MNYYDSLLEKIYPLSNENKKRLIVDIYKFLSVNDANNERPERCPYCGSYYIVKNGKNKSKQRYLCKNCRKSFINKINTPVYYSKKSKYLWIKFIDCLINSKSVRDTSKALKISPSTAFYWRHKVLDALREHEKETMSKLSGNVNCLEMRFKQSFKGNHSKKNFTMPRKSITGNLQYKYCNFPHVSVLVAADQNERTIIAPVKIGVLAKQDLLPVFEKSIKENSNISSSYLPTICNYFKPHVELSQKFTINLDKNTSSTEYKCARLTTYEINTFLAPFKGVATKYLYNYLSLYFYISSRYACYKQIPLDVLYKIPQNSISSNDYLYLLQYEGSTAYTIKNYKGRPPALF